MPLPPIGNGMLQAGPLLNHCTPTLASCGPDLAALLTKPG
jgi:hypothetical protein